MKTNTLPPYKTDAPETGCCPKFDFQPWDNQEIVFSNMPFVKANTLNFMHIPLTMGSMMKKTWKKIEDAKAAAKNQWLLLSYDPSPWKGEHYFMVTKKVPVAENVEITGKFLTKVFEGPYKEVRNWVGEMDDLVSSKGKKLNKLYFFYTTCPKCAKHYGKNYTVGFAQVE
jgi:hypothetical protein